MSISQFTQDKIDELAKQINDKETEYTQNELLGKGQWTAPVLPMQAGYTLGPYKHNG